MAGRSRQVIRKVQTSPVADFDDQLWPVNCAILILAGFVAGIVIATSDFDDPHIFSNAWFGLGTLVVAVGLLFGSAAWLKERMVRRVQFCVLLSLLLHLFLGMFLHDQYLALVAQREQAAQQEAEKKEPITVPDYYWQHIEQSPPRQSFEKPVETPAPEETEPEALRRQETKHEKPLRKQPLSEPETPPQQQPDPSELQRAVLSAPHRAEKAAGVQISRQEFKRRPEPDRPIPQPRIEPQPQQTASASSANTEPVRQQPSRVPTKRQRTAEVKPRPIVQREAMNLARRTTSTDSLRPTVSRPVRQHTVAAEVSHSQATAEEPIPAAEAPRPPGPKPNVQLTRQQSNGPVAKRQATEPMPSMPRSVSRMVALTGRRRAERPADQIVHLPALNRVARQTVGEAAPPQIEQPLGPQADSSQPPTSLLAAPGGTSAAKTAGGSVQVDQRKGPTAEVPAAIPDTRLTLAIGRRATGSQQQARPDTLPSKLGGLARAAAGVGLPSIAVATSTAPHAALAAGGTPPSRIEAAAGARVGRSAAGMPSSGSTVAASVAEPAISSSQIMVPSGRPSSTGSERQLAASGMTIPRIGRTRRPGPSLAGASTPVAEPAGSSGETTGSGGRPLSVPGTSATAAVRVGNAVTARPKTGAGPAASGGSDGSPIRVAVAGPARVDGHDGLSSSPAGGGTASPARTPGPAPTPETLASLSGETGVTGTAEGASGTSPQAGAGEERESVGMGGALPGESGIANPAATFGDRVSGRRLQAAGLPGRPMGEPASAGDMALGGPAVGTLGSSMGSRRAALGDHQPPFLAADAGGLLLRKSSALGTAGGPAETIQLPLASASGPASPGPLPEPAAGSGAAGPARQRGGLPVAIAALAGPGGLNPDPSPEVGIPSRRARRDSEVVHTIARRFIQRSGGLLAIDGHVYEPPREAFRQRDPGSRAEVARGYGGTNENEEAVELGLDFLARHQFPDGHWSLNEFPSSGEGYEDAAAGQMQSDTAATGLALLAFLGAGYTHSGDKHRAVVRRGLDWMITSQKADGELFSGGTNYARFYSHGIGAIALCEAYGMTRDTELHEPCQKAIRFIVNSQHPTAGGWRYQPRTESDTSVSGWLLMALKSAQMAGLEVPQEALKGVSGWLDLAQAEGGSRYVYNPLAADTEQQRTGRRPNLSMTAEGLLMRMYLGWQRRNPALLEGAEHLKSNLPAWGNQARPLRDAYYWYYATQVMFQMQGEYWDSWHKRLHPLLVASQQRTGPLAGSWHPLRPVPDHWGHAGGRQYVTTMNLLMLEVYYRHLPLFQTLAE